MWKMNIVQLMLLMLSIDMMTSQASRNCPKCQGLFCGRPTNISKCEGTCGSCPRGYRTNAYSCSKCENMLQLYDWLFLGFMLICVIVLNFYAIDMFHSSESKNWLYPLSVISESLIGFLLMVLSFAPKGRLTMNACGVKSIKDWYTVFYNPSPDHVSVIRCTQEAVYPLYTSIFMYLLYNLVLMILFRGLLLPYICKKKNFKSLYAGLYILPFVGAIHTCFAGVIYYIYPYLMIFLSVIGVAVFLSTLNQDFYDNLKKPRHLGVLACYCVAHAYGIISITEMKVPARDGPVLLLVFLPVLFYASSRKFTNAERFKTF